MVDWTSKMLFSRPDLGEIVANLAIVFIFVFILNFRSAKSVRNYQVSVLAKMLKNRKYFGLFEEGHCIHGIAYFFLNALKWRQSICTFARWHSLFDFLRFWHYTNYRRNFAILCWTCIKFPATIQWVHLWQILLLMPDLRWCFSVCCIAKYFIEFLTKIIAFSPHKHCEKCHGACWFV